MRVVDVNAFYAPLGGGVRSYVDRKLAAAASLGIDITVVAPGDADRIERRAPTGRVQWLRSPAFPLDRRYRYFDDPGRVHALLDALAPDLVEASSPWRTAEIVAGWEGPARRALVMHADPLAAYAYRWFSPVASLETIDRGFDWFWRRLRRYDRAFDLIVSPSRSLSARLRSGGLSRVATIPLGLTDTLFSPSLRSATLRRALLEECGLGPNALLLLGVGRLSAEKRWSMVIDAVAAAGCRRPIGLVVIGEGRERPRLLRQLAGNPHIQLLPEVRERPRLARIMASADALVHGCEAETFCLVAAEARASGLPLIVPDRGGASDQATGPSDRRFGSGSTEELADILVNFKPGRSMPDPNRRTLLHHFEELALCYRGLARGPRPVPPVRMEAA